MAEKQSILGRIAQLAKANINALIDRAEDPAKMIDQLIRDYSNSIAEAETSVAQTIGNLRLAEKDYEEDALPPTGVVRPPPLLRRPMSAAQPGTPLVPTSGITSRVLPSASRSSLKVRLAPPNRCWLLSVRSRTSSRPASRR